VLLRASGDTDGSRLALHAAYLPRVPSARTGRAANYTQSGWRQRTATRRKNSRRNRAASIATPGKAPISDVRTENPHRPCVGAAGVSRRRTVARHALIVRLPRSVPFVQRCAHGRKGRPSPEASGGRPPRAIVVLGPDASLVFRTLNPATLCWRVYNAQCAWHKGTACTQREGH
jgi:hypothetical protein